MNGIAGAYLLWLCGALFQQAGDHPVRSLRFQLDRDGPPSLHYSIDLQLEAGTGVYSATSTGAAAANTADLPHASPIHVSQAVLKKLLAAQPVVAGRRCESHSKSIAQTGLKTMRFSDGDLAAECRFNYSDDDRLNAATALLEGMAETMQYGDRLTADLRFDRLGLDTEMNNLQSALEQHRVVEVGNIAPVLQSIAEDDRVMDRVRRKAARLLAPAQSGAAGDTSDR